MELKNEKRIYLSENEKQALYVVGDLLSSIATSLDYKECVKVKQGCLIDEFSFGDFINFKENIAEFASWDLFIVEMEDK